MEPEPDLSHYIACLLFSVGGFALSVRNSLDPKVPEAGRYFWTVLSAMCASTACFIFRKLEVGLQEGWVFFTVLYVLYARPRNQEKPQNG